MLARGTVVVCCLSVRPSVRLSVRHAAVLYRNGLTHRHSSFPVLNIFCQGHPLPVTLTRLGTSGQGQGLKVSRPRSTSRTWIPGPRTWGTKAKAKDLDFGLKDQGQGLHCLLGGRWVQGYINLAIFDQYLAICGRRYGMRSWLIWNSRKSVRSIEPWHFRWPWNTFEGHFDDLLLCVRSWRAIC